MLEMTFESSGEEFLEAVEEYRTIWREDGNRIVAALESHSGFSFLQTTINANVLESTSYSGSDVRPMRLRASYPTDVKRATVVHELGHRLIEHRQNRIADLDEHQHLFLFLYKAWVDLYGEDFAQKMVVVESGRKGIYDYEATWNWYVALSEKERVQLLHRFQQLNQQQDT